MALLLHVADATLALALVLGASVHQLRERGLPVLTPVKVPSTRTGWVYSVGWGLGSGVVRVIDRLDDLETLERRRAQVQPSRRPCLLPEMPELELDEWNGGSVP